MMMKLITVRYCIRRVANRWDSTYESHGWTEETREISNNLRALDPSIATKEDVHRIIGNRGWTNLKCDECETEDLDRVVMVGQEPDYESATASLCLSCAKKALQLIETP